MKNDFDEKKSLGSRALRFSIIVLVGEAMNLLFHFLLADAAHIALWFDTIGTVAVTFYAGLVPGVVVAALYNVLCVIILAVASKSPIYPWDMIYALCGIAITVTTWLFARKKENFRMSRLITTLYLVLIALVSAFASSVAGGIIETVNRLHFGNLAYSSVLEQFVRAFLGENIGILASCIIVRIPVTVLDRLICTFAGFGIYKLFSKENLYAE